jgi:hypothetical protein
MLALGLVLFVAGYLVYARYLGGIDGLPPLPQALLPPDPKNPAPSYEPPSKRDNPLLRKVLLGFDEGCEERGRPIKLELNSKSTLLTADTFFIEPDGRLRLEPLSVALFGKPKTDSRGFEIIEINTIRCRKAYLTFDKPLEKLTDVNGRKIVGAELIDKIEVVNKRRPLHPDITPRDNLQRTDDIWVYIANGPLYFDDKTHLIKTNDIVHLIDGRSKPKPMEIWGRGLEMELAVESPPADAAHGPRSKGEKITGVKRIVLQSNVEMHLYVDARSNFPAGQAAPAGPASKPPQTPADAPEKAHVTIKSPGKFVYELMKDCDLAHFDVTPAGGVASKSTSPQDVTVTRHNERLNLVDQLVCEHLDLKLLRKENKPTPAPAGSKVVASDPGADRSFEIETVHAVGKTVTIASDAEKLTAQGGDLFYDAKAKRTVLKGNPEMIAIKEDNTIHAREMHIEERPPATPGGKPYQYATAFGPGRIEMVDKDPPTSGAKSPAKPDDKPAPKKPVLAFWDDTLVSTKDGAFDLLILNRSARFVDEEHGQTLQGDTIKVWLDPGDKPTGTTAAPAQPTAAQARRPHHVETYGNVSAKSSELNVHETGRLVVWFRDEEAPKVLPSPVVPKPQPATPPPASHQSDKATAAPAPAPAAKKEEAPPRPIDLTARSVEARVIRGETKNTLETLRCEGQVHVQQDPAKPGEKGVDITGSKLAMDYHEEGNLLVVTGDDKDTLTGDDVAILQMDTMLIIGNDVHIDQASNKAWVVGPGVMRMESKTSLSGDQLKQPVPLTVNWQDSMLFNGNYAEFHGNDQAEQENARLACDSLVVFFDRRISLKEGNKDDKPARVQHMMCETAVRVEDSVFEGKERTKFQQIVAPEVSFNSLYPEDEAPGKTERVSDGNEVFARGVGEVRIMQKGGVDPLAPPAAAPGAAPAKPKQAAAKPNDDEMKMTYVNFAKSMYANSKKNYAKFIGNVRAVNFPCNDPHINIDIDFMLDRMPEGAMYLRSDVLEVWTHQAKDRKYSEMHAKGGALVQSNEFWGRSATIHFDESKDQIIFDGGEAKATLFKIIGKGQPPQKVEAKKIFYIRSTGQFWIDKGNAIEGTGAGSVGPGK